ncbi:hypothetical protein CVT25_001547, partial [Psilocybe cyanescens]
ASEQIRHGLPPNTKGHLYYHLENGRPLISGEVRMQICDGPSDFEKGHDLFDMEYRLVHMRAFITYCPKRTSWDLPLHKPCRSIVLLFIRSTLPEDADHPPYLLKFLKFLTALRCVISGYDLQILQPRVGEFLQRLNRQGAYHH